MAINRAVEAILSGDQRLLLTLATGTGKTFVSLQIVWKLWSGAWCYARTSGRWARAVHESIDRIGALFPAGHAAAVIELAEYGRVDKAMSTLDDSSGWFSQIISELERLHHEACLFERPDPIALGRRLFGGPRCRSDPRAPASTGRRAGSTSSA